MTTLNATDTGAPHLGGLRVAIVTTAAAGVGLFLVAVSDLSTMWQLLVFLAIGTATAMVWSRDIRTFLMCGMAFTAPIGISKGLVAHGGIYSPALELFPVDLFLAALLVVWLVDRKLMRRTPTRIGVGWRIVLAWMAWSWICVLFAADRLAGVLAGINLTTSFLMFVMIADLVESTADIRRVLMAAGAGLALNLVMVAAQFVTGRQLELQGAKAATLGVQLTYDATGGVSAFRPSGFLLHPNKMADYLTLLLPTLLLLTLLGPARLGRRAWWPSLGLLLGGAVALLVTLSRAGWISFTVAAAFALIVGYRGGLVRKSQLVAIAIAVVVGIGAITAAYPAIYYRLAKSDNQSTRARLLMMDQAWLIIRRHPIVGVGLGGYNDAAQRNIPESFASVPPKFQETLLAGVVHQHFLLIWAEGGVIALVLALLLFGTFIRSYFRIPHWRDPALQTIHLGLVAGLVGHVTFCNFDHFYFDITRYTIWIMLGLLAASARLSTRAAVPVPSSR